MAKQHFNLSPSPTSDKSGHQQMKIPKKLSSSAFENFQMNLFQDFLCNKEEERDKLGNTIDLWDSVPKYSVSKQAMNKLRSADGSLKLLKIDFKFDKINYKVIIQPARIEQVIDEETGETKEIDFYPSANEELVEDALRKIAADQQQGFFDKASYRSGAVFTLFMLREELKKRGHTRSLTEIILSLTILAKSNIEIRQDDGSTTGFGISPYLPALAGVTRKDYEEDSNAKWLAQFHPLVTKSIEAIAYRQFNYDKMMGHSTQLARWIHKLLSIKYTNASHTENFGLYYSVIKRDSGLLNHYKLNRQAVAAVDSAFDELVAAKMLMSYSKTERRGKRNKIEDVLYTLTASVEFIREMKASNKRLSDAKQAVISRA